MQFHSRLACLCARSFQEIVPLTATNVLGIEDEETVARWDAVLRRSLDTAAAAADEASAASSGLASDSDIGSESFSNSTSSAYAVPALETEWRRPDGRKYRIGEGLSLGIGVEGAGASPDSQVNGGAVGTMLKSASLGGASGSDDLYAVPLTPVNAEEEKPGGHQRKPSGLSAVPNTHAEPESPVAPSTYTGTEGGKEGQGGNEEANETVDLAPSEEEAVGEQRQRQKRGEYVKVVARQMAGIYLTVWVRRRLRRHVHGVKACIVGCGIMGILGNKVSPCCRIVTGD